MMNCLISNFIGILGCNRPSPASGLYINSLPGMSVKSFSMLTTEEKPTYLNVWDDIQLRAVKKFQTDVYGELNKRWKIQNILDSIDLGRKIDTTSVTAASAEYRGFEKDLDYGYDNEEIKKSALQTHYIQTLSYYSPIVQVGTIIKIFDKDLQIEIDSFTFAAAIGWNVIQVNKNYTPRRISVLVNSTNLNSVSLTIPSSAQWNSCDTIQGAKMTIGDFTSYVTGENTFGLSGVIGTRCKWDSLVCNNLDVFTESFWYLLGSETMVEAITTNRVNFVTTDKKRSAYLKNEVYDVRYEQALSQAVANIELSQSDLCIECNEMITIKEADAFSCAPISYGCN